MSGLLAAAGAAALAVAAPAASPFGLTLSPPVVHAAPGHVAEVRVWDTGTAPAKVVVTLRSVAKLSGKCTAGAAPVRGVTLAGPSSFSLKPGGSAIAHVRVGAHAPAQDDAVIFTADPASGGNVHVTGAVGAQLLVSGSHGARTAGCSSAKKPHTQPTPPGAVTAADTASTSGQDAGLAAAGVALLSLLIGLRMRRRGGHHRPRSAEGGE